MVCQCSACSRMFEVSEIFKKMVDAKKIPVEDILCGGCDKSHKPEGDE